jgi:GNAT superfamily N-acetyltransferase
MDVYNRIVTSRFDLKKFKDMYECDTDCDFSPLENLDAILLEDLHVKEDYKRCGYGKRFVDELKREGKPIVLYSLFEAEPFWEKQGFKNVVDEHIYLYKGEY